MSDSREVPDIKGEVVQSVTTAASSTDEEEAARIKRYLITMGIRTACFILMVVVDGWLRWVFAAGAIFLPYFAVVLANARRPPTPGKITPVDDRPVDPNRHLTSGA